MLRELGDTNAGIVSRAARQRQISQTLNHSHDPRSHAIGALRASIDKK